MRFSFIIPTRNRHDELAHTLHQLASYDPALLANAAEVIVADNASDAPVRVPSRLANAIPVHLIRLDHNAGAAARNTAAQRATGDWLVMLDDDSHPTAGDFAALAQTAPDDLAAIGAEILLPSGIHESGGLPEVIIGCACIIRRHAFLAVGGYDPSFEYYAEEYDLCAKLIAAGHRITHSRALRFEHRKVDSGRSFDRILARLVRNNGWVIARYAPDHLRDDALRAMLDRYRTIAHRERAQTGYNDGIDELTSTIDNQPRVPLSPEHWDRFTGLAACRAHLIPQIRQHSAKRIALVARGKGDDLIELVIRESGAELVTDDQTADLRIAGSLSPGPMMDAARAHESKAAWSMAPEPLCSHAKSRTTM